MATEQEGQLPACLRMVLNFKWSSSGDVSGVPQHEGSKAGVTLIWKMLGAYQIALVVKSWVRVSTSGMDETR